MDSREQFFFSLLRISTAQMLRHAGLAGSRPSVLDTLTDITARYLTVLGETARNITESSNRTHSELSDVLSAMEHVGLLRPLTIYNPDLNDTRAVDNFIQWAKSPEVEELRKLAGVVTAEVDEADEEEEQVPDTVMATQNAINNSGIETESLARDLSKKAPTKSAELETDIPIKREETDQPTPMMMDIDGVPSMNDLNAGTPAVGGAGGSVARDTEPPPDGGAENTKSKVRLKQVDWFTALRLKEDAARFKGTVLGKHGEEKKVVIEGGDSVPVQL